MQDWSDGYVTDIGYTYGYYTELNPQRARLSLLSAGIIPPDVRTACELGFGQGVSINIHDAASGTEWHGTDFNPAHAGFASELAGTSALAGRVSDQAFEEYCNRPDLPDFDFIALHGIWSWVSDANRACIADFIKRKLKVGGVLYISYNTQPGWAAMAPVRDLLSDYVDTMSPSGVSKAQGIDGALHFAEKLMASGANFAKANPAVTSLVKKLREQDHNYLAHEYLNKDWMPMPFARMAEWMTSLKLQFVCSANFLDQVPALNLTAEQQQLMAGIPDATFRETTRDFMVNQRFRRDYWVRGARRLGAFEQLERLRNQHVMLVHSPEKISYKASGSLGDADLQRKIYEPLVEVLADHVPRTIGEIEHLVASRGVGMQHLLQAVTVMTGTGAMQPTQDPASIEQARAPAACLNTALGKLARYSGNISYAASPVTGGGIGIGRMDQIFMLACKQGIGEPSGWARFAADVLTQQGQRLKSEGNAVQSLELQLEELLRQANGFARERLPILKALGIAA